MTFYWKEKNRREGNRRRESRSPDQIALPLKEKQVHCKCNIHEIMQPI